MFGFLIIGVIALIAILVAVYRIAYGQGYEACMTERAFSSLLGDLLMAVNGPEESITDVNDAQDYLFVHECVEIDCHNMVEFDDEPWCFTHSPDEGSSLPGYSARRQAEQEHIEF